MRVNFFSQAGTQNTGPSQGLNATITGPLILAGNPTGPLEATPKQYVDSSLNSLNAVNMKTGTLSVARLPAFTGDAASATGSGNFILSNSGVSAGTYTKVTVDAKGRVVSGSNINVDDIPPFNWSKITTDKPITVEGYGITDMLKSNGATVTGTLSLTLDPTNNLHAANKQYVDSLGNNGALVSTGMIVRRTMSTTPSGFLRANGGEVSRTGYSALFASVKEPYQTKVDFSYTSYMALGAGVPWQQQYDINTAQNADINSWVAATAFPININSAQVLITKNRVYVLGGNSNNQTLATVYSAYINSDGTLGTWTQGFNLAVATRDAQLVVTKNRVYLIGGFVNNSSSTIVQTAPINSDGTLGNWVQTTSMSNNASGSYAFATKNKVFMLANTGFTSRWYFAPINADGTLGTWDVKSSATDLSVSLRNACVAITKNRVYVIGGYSTNGSGTSATTNTVYSAPITASGDVGSWTTESAFPIAMHKASCVVVKNKVFVFGGNQNNGTIQKTVYSATINADGSLSAWSSNTSIPTVVYDHMTFIVKDKVYLLGGSTTSGNETASVYMGTMTGSLNDYSEMYNGSVNKFDGSDLSGSVVVGNDYDNVIYGRRPGGGQPWRQQFFTNSQAIQSLSSWTSDISLPAMRTGSVVFVTKNRVYVIGGWDGNSSYTNTVYTSAINTTTGALSGWTTATAFPVTLHGGSVFVTNNRVYVIGGTQNSSNGTNTYTAPINADGTVGTWTTGPTMPEASSKPAVFVLKNKAYYLAAYTGSGYSEKIYCADINADGTLGNFKHVSSLGEQGTSRTAIVLKSRVYLASNSGGNDFWTATYNSDGELGAWEKPALRMPNVSMMEYVVTEKAVYMFGNGSGSAYYSAINADDTLGTINTIANAGYTNISNAFATNNYLYMVYGTNSSNPHYLIRMSFAGGLNDYSKEYSGSFITVTSSSFALPDLSKMESPSEFYFVKT